MEQKNINHEKNLVRKHKLFYYRVGEKRMDFPNEQNYFFIYDYNNTVVTHEIPEHLHEYILPLKKYFLNYPYNVSDKKFPELHEVPSLTNNVSKMTTDSITPVKFLPVTIRKKYVLKKLSEYLMIKFRFMMEHGTFFDIKLSSPLFIYARCYINIILNKHTLKSR